MLLHEDRPHDALAWLDAMGNDRDRAVSFWAALVRGYALDALGRTTDAASAFQEALSIVPHAQSASIALMLDLARLGQREDAGAVAEAATRDSSVDDPWWEYDRGDFRFVKAWLDELRKDNR